LIYVACTVAGAFICAIAQATSMAATRYMHPLKVCFYRFTIAVPFCYLAGFFTTGKTLPGVTVEQFLYIGSIGFIAWGIGGFLFFYAMSKGSMHRVAPISNSLVIFVVILSIIFLGEPFFKELIFIVLILGAGIGMIAPTSKNDKQWKPAVPVAVMVAFLWGTSIVMTKVAVAGVPYPYFVFIKMIFTSGFFFIVQLFYKTPSNKKGILLCFASALALVAGDSLLMMAVDGLPASIFSPIYATVIPFGFVFSVVFLKEKPHKRNWWGMGLIFLAAAICGYLGSN